MWLLTVFSLPSSSSSSPLYSSSASLSSHLFPSNPTSSFPFQTNKGTGDLRLLTASRTQAHNQFQSNSHLPPCSSDTQTKISEALEVVKFLRRNVVQGVRVDSPSGGREGERGEREGEGEGKDSKNGTWRLNIHEEVERGDNASIKTKIGGKAKEGGIECCGGGR